MREEGVEGWIRAEDAFRELKGGGGKVTGDGRGLSTFCEGVLEAGESGVGTGVDEDSRG
jgi:hypothetical protein